jgi:hypothetical protein
VSPLPPCTGLLTNNANSLTAETPSIEGLTTCLGLTHHKDDILEGKNNKEAVNNAFPMLFLNFLIKLIHQLIL